MASADVQEDVKCSICMDIYTDPVTLKCGHNFCQECIKGYLDTKQRNREDYRCPQCRKRCRKRPVLQKNIDLANIAEKLKSSAGQNTKCSDHDRILELYCTEDSTCICKLCRFEGKHRGHEVETLEEASERKKNKLKNDLQILIAKREKTEKRAQDLHQHRATAKEHRAELEEKVTALFIDIRRRVDDLENRVRSELSRQAKQENLVSNLIRKLEVQKKELSRKIGHMEKLNTADPITLLQDQELYGHTEDNLDLCWNETCEPDEFIISIMLQKGLSDIEKMRNTLFPVLPQGSNITLHMNTASEYVEISDDRKTAKSTNVRQKRPDPANMLTYGRVLSTRAFSSGKHYWMVEGSTTGEWAIGMCYPRMRKEWEWIGENGESWAIKRSDDLYVVKHNKNDKYIHHKTSSNKWLVYLDYQAGRLSFYELSDPPKLLHTFTEPLHAVLQVKKNIINNSHSQITVLQKDAWCNPMLEPITST